MPDAYDRWLAPTIFDPFAAELADRVARRAPQQVLELAAGTAALTRALLARGVASVVAPDLNDAMVALGATRAPGATWRTADALHLPFGDAQFDAVACSFGVMFFPDRRAAYAQTRRVLREGGAFLATTWTPIAEHAYAKALMDALEAELGVAPPFLTTIPHGYHDEATIRDDLAAGGLECTHFDVIILEGHAAAAADIAHGFCTGTPLRAQLEAR